MKLLNFFDFNTANCFDAPSLKFLRVKKNRACCKNECHVIRGSTNTKKIEVIQQAMISLQGMVNESLF